MQPLRRLALVIAVLGGNAEEMSDAKLPQHGEMIPERTGLRRATASAGDRIPALRQRLPGDAGARIEVDHRPALEPGQIDLRSVGRRKRDRRKLETRQVPRAAIVLRYRKLRR